MSFYEFMIKNFIDEESPLGDLARDMRDDKEMLENKYNNKRIFEYLDFKIKDKLVEETFKEAKNEYRKAIKKRNNFVKELIEWLSGMECNGGRLYIEYYIRDGESHIANINNTPEERIGLINFLTQHDVTVRRIERIY